ncbi:ATP-binding protein [Streptomyces sp. NPDC005925]|uniref:sensor histidine kinase n=1 Tax=Streptomyces sp. NPDC005925 TaxID=3157172 RepID=UPI0033DC759D
MSHLRAPAGRADRREGGRHGRPVVRTTPALPGAGIRHQLMRMAVLPPVAVALSGCAAVLFTVRSTGAGPSPALWAVLAGAFSVTVAGVLTGAVAADRAARTVRDRVADLRRSTARGEAELHALLEQLRRGDGPPPRRTPPAGPPEHADDFELLAADLDHAHDAAVSAVVQAAQLSSQTGSEQKLEVFVNLARRLQSLVHREISALDELENEIEDPDLLKGLFHVDHLATRIRRHAENLAVLGGAVSRRQWSNPVPMIEVLRSAIAEVEQYSRVRLVPPLDGDLRGHAVADVIHLLAELVENATVFSAPHTPVLLRAGFVTSGLAVEIEDRGLGMPAEERSRMNALLADPDQVNVAGLLSDGRIGLYVVSQLARRHGITVRLQSNIYGGVQAVLVVPQELLGPAPVTAGAVPATQELPPAVQGAWYGGSGLDVTEDVPQYTADVPPYAAPEAYGAPGPGVPYTPSRYDDHDVPPGTGLPHAPHTTPAPDVPPPLPVRGAHRPRPTEAAPGARPDDRQTPAEHPDTPYAGTARGAMDKPHLPRRRAQEHLAPQLRGGPPPRQRQDSDDTVGHDPGLMAAFQRGIGRAESEQRLDTGAYGVDPGRTATPYPYAHQEPLRDEPAPFVRPAVSTTLAAGNAGDAVHAHGIHDDGGPLSRTDHTARPDRSSTAG